MHSFDRPLKLLLNHCIFCFFVLFINLTMHFWIDYWLLSYIGELRVLHRRFVHWAWGLLKWTFSLVWLIKPCEGLVSTFLKSWDLPDLFSGCWGSVSFRILRVGKWIMVSDLKLTLTIFLLLVQLRSFRVSLRIELRSASGVPRIGRRDGLSFLGLHPEVGGGNLFVLFLLRAHREPLGRSFVSLHK